MSTGRRFGGLGQQMALFMPTVINSKEELETLAAEMKAYARANPFDHDEAGRKAAANKLVETEMHQGAMRAKGDPVSIAPWMKMVTFDNGETPPYQIMYTEGPKEGKTGTMQFLNIVAYERPALDKIMAVNITAAFWDHTNQAIWGSLMRLDRLPPHVAIVIRQVQNGEEL